MKDMTLRELKALRSKKEKECEALLAEIDRRTTQKDLASQQKMIGKCYQEDDRYYRVLSVFPETADAHVFFFTLIVDDDTPLFECGFTTFYPHDNQPGLVKISVDEWNDKLDEFYGLLDGVTH